MDDKGKINEDKAEIVLARDSKFEEGKKKLKDACDDLPKNIELKSFETKGFLGLCKYHTTGEDINLLSGEIKDMIISQNKTIIQFSDIFKDVYDMFCNLDTEYIQKIMISQRAAEKANDNAAKAISQLKKEQNEIKRITAIQERIVSGLNQFKDKLEKMEHLLDVDKSFEEISIIKRHVEDIIEKIGIQELSIDSLSGNLDKIMISYTDIEKSLNILRDKQVKEIERTEKLISNQSQNTARIETVYNEYKNSTMILNKKIDTQESKLNNANESMSKDIKNLFEKVDIENNELNTKFITLTDDISKKQIDFENITTEHTAEIEKMRLLIDNLSRTLKITRIICIISVILIAIFLILIMSGVL